MSIDVSEDTGMYDEGYNDGVTGRAARRDDGDYLEGYYDGERDGGYTNSYDDDYDWDDDYYEDDED